MWTGHVVRIEETRNACSLFIRKLGNRLHGGPGKRLEDNINLGLRETVYDGGTWIKVVQGLLRCHSFTSCVGLYVSINLLEKLVG
jgi:hypothetical protein